MVMKKIQVREFPKCDFCGKPAPYDDKTKWGPWANMCEEHEKQNGLRIGSKRTLIKKREVKHRFNTEPIVNIPLTMDSVATVKCPWCGQKRRVETDANFHVTCQSCGNPYKLRSAI